MAAGDIEQAERLAGDSLTPSVDADRAIDRFEQRSDHVVPAVLRRMHRTGLLDWQAAAFGSGVVAPDDFELELCGDGERRLRIVDENQGVCAWFVAVEEADDPPVLVDFFDGTPPIEYASSLSSYALASSWDRAHLFSDGPAPLLQAQADELDDLTLVWLRSRWEERVPTFGWPSDSVHRFERDRAHVLLWSCEGQCDWSIRATSSARLEAAASELIELSNLDTSLWSNEVTGEELLRSVRARRSI